MATVKWKDPELWHDILCALEQADVDGRLPWHIKAKNTNAGECWAALFSEVMSSHSARSEQDGNRQAAVVALKLETVKRGEKEYQECPSTFRQAMCRILGTKRNTEKHPVITLNKENARAFAKYAKSLEEAREASRSSVSGKKRSHEEASASAR
eukprot:TRINITY_DN48350_c0_g1_i1.p2 TRINITY_DN48350_c0_g1~~TRINITY_DN48350_c0_g1_i1.p2  ORF type:complete len:154 (-),score=12.78 TRINITY_DN48350_c0_g1_i1:990-1451(-)